MARTKKTPPRSDCERELIRSGEDPSQATEICRSKETSEGPAGGMGSPPEKEELPYDD